MKVLVTGGAGFIGGCTVRDLLKSGHEVLVFDNLCCGHRQILPKGIELIIGDIREEESIRKALSGRGFDAVMHFAAFTIVPESVEDPAKYFENNVRGSINVMNAMAKEGVGLFVFSSSAAVYGAPKKIPIVETEPTLPENTYGQTKLTIEEYLKWYEAPYGIKHVCLRYFNAAGADLENDIGEDREVETHLIPLVLHAASGARKDVKVFGTDYPTPDGTCIRDYIHVKDLASAHVLALEKLSKTKQSAVYNLGSESGFSVRQIVEAAEKITKKGINAVDSPRRAGDPPALIASSAKIKSALGWQQKHSTIEKIISDTWEWHLKHPQGYKK
ncbi:MAG: UDP-glucose 4-epimerase GalE [Candidatus Margulisiibacteriota bacterium]